MDGNEPLGVNLILVNLLLCCLVIYIPNTLRKTVPSARADSDVVWKRRCLVLLAELTVPCGQMLDAEHL